MLHEALVEMFRRAPHLLLELLGNATLAAPPGDAQFEPGDTTFSQLTEVDADLVLKVEVDGEVVSAVVVEVQLSPNPKKPASWAVYQTGAHRRYGCPAFVVVVAVDAAVAQWAAGPFDTGQMRWQPIVLGPDAVPIVADAERIELTMLSALAHAHEPVAMSIGEALLEGLDQSDTEGRDYYWDLLLHSLNESARKALTMHIANYEPQSEWGKKLFREGQRDALLGALWGVLHARDIEVSPEQREAFEACGDPQRLGQWVRRAATAASAAELFDA